MLMSITMEIARYFVYISHANLNQYISYIVLYITGIYIENLRIHIQYNVNYYENSLAFFWYFIVVLLIF